jgi:hypothetical protein
MKIGPGVHVCTWLLIAGLIISGLTAIPISSELAVGRATLGGDWSARGLSPAWVTSWLRTLDEGLGVTAAQAPFMFYGTDWLAFGHLMIALVFVGALKDPVRNRWLYQFGMIASMLVPLWAVIFGQVRGIPLWWRAIDCSFGVGAFIPAWLCFRWTAEASAEERLGRTRDEADGSQA